MMALLTFWYFSFPSFFSFFIMIYSIASWENTNQLSFKRAQCLMFSLKEDELLKESEEPGWTQISHSWAMFSDELVTSLSVSFSTRNRKSLYLGGSFVGRHPKTLYLKAPGPTCGTQWNRNEDYPGPAGSKRGQGSVGAAISKLASPTNMRSFNLGPTWQYANLNGMKFQELTRETCTLKGQKMLTEWKTVTLKSRNHNILWLHSHS